MSYDAKIRELGEKNGKNTDKIHSMNQVHEIMENFTRHNIFETCLSLQKFATELEELESIKEVYDSISTLAVQLVSDEEKIKVLAGFDRKNIERLYADDKKNSNPAEPAFRIFQYTQNSFDFLRRIVNSIENNIEFEASNTEQNTLPNEYSYVLAAQSYQPNQKLNIPYYQIAKNALMKWYDLSEEEAEKKILESDFDKIESKIYAKQSIESAVSKIGQISDVDESKIFNMVYNGHKDLIHIDKSIYGNAEISNRSAISNIKEYFSRRPEENIIDILSAVHDNWVKTNPNKFFSREKKHQHMPIELIGWEETKADLIFVQPILEAMGIEVNELGLGKAYNKRTKHFFLDNDIKTKDDLTDKISKGEAFYSSLEGQEEILNALSNPDFVRESVVPQIEEQGIGTVDAVRKDIIEQIAKNPNDKDMNKLTDSEIFAIENQLDNENSKLEEEYSKLTEKERAIERIKEKSIKHKELKQQIIQIKEEHKNKATEAR